MRSRSSLVAFAATLVLHLCLAAAIVFSLPDSQDNKQIEPVKVALLQPAAAPQAEPPAIAAPQAEKVAPKRESRPAAKPEAKHPGTVTAPPGRADTTTEMKQPVPSAAGPSSSTSPTPQSAAPASGASPTASPPIRTAVTDATYASTNRKPPYPRISLSNEEEGTVILRVLVKADGTAGPVEIKQSSGHPRLDEAARSTVQTWRFSPATVDGKSVAEWYQVAIPFTLQSN